MLKFFKGLLNIKKTFMQLCSCIGSFLGPLNVNTSLLEITQTTEKASEIIGNGMASLWESILELINTWVYFLSKLFFQFIDFCEVVINKIAGINANLNFNFDIPIFRLLLSDTFFKVFSALFIIGIIFLVVFTIIAIIKSEYQLATGQEKLEKDKKNGSVSYVVKRSLLATFMMVLVPLILIVCFAFTSVMLSSINNVLRTDEHDKTSVGGQIFVTSAYGANRYRTYAQTGQRIPILLDFNDPYQDGSYIYYTSEELHNMYEAWEDGESVYNMVKDKNYASFNDTLTYRNNMLVNSSNYSSYENWISTAEQYYVMADFIDYAVKNNLEFYIKDSNDSDIDWSSSSKNIQISGGVYDTQNKTLTINYVNKSGLGSYGEDYYTLSLSTNKVSATSPLQNAIDTLSNLMAIELEQEKERINSGVLSNASLETYEDVNAEISDTKLFRILERVEDSTNVVRWKTEKVTFNDENYTVYNLTKRYFNSQTGVIDERGTVQVARKETGGKFYIVKNNNGVYEYSNQTIDYVNDGASYVDKLEPVFVYVGWAEKLYNDLDVIYHDINFKNYINYDNWADALGEYFSPNSNVTSENVATFATTLIHPLGLIMSELFLGVTFENESKTGTKFSFTTQYSEDIVKQLCLTVGGQYSYNDIMNEVDTYMRIFNGLLTPIMEDLQKIEGFDMPNESEYSVYCYVYKAYLCSILLSDDFGNYLSDLAYEILNISNLVDNIYNGSNSVTYDKNGEKVYEKQYTYSSSGDLIPLLSNVIVNNSYVTGKYVYAYDTRSGNGKKLLACDAMGKITEDGAYVINPSYSYQLINGEYCVYLAGEYRSASNYLSYCIAKGETGVDLSNIFIPYYKIQYNTDKTVAYMMVYEPSTSTTKDLTNVKLVNAIDENGHPISIDVGTDSEGNIQDEAVVTNAMSSLSSKYYLYEYEMVPKYKNTCLRYSELSTEEQKAIDNCINYIMNDIVNKGIDEPEFLSYLKEYQQDGSQMADVMNAPNITSAEAKEIGSNLENLKQSLNDIENESKKLAVQKLINSYKKYQIIYGLNNYLSTRVSSGFNVVVNGHSYNVGQELTTRKILEYAFGNKLLNTSLINMLNTETTFSNLSNYNQQAFINLKSKSNSDLKILDEIIDKLKELNTSLLTSIELSDTELDLIYEYYYLYGITKNKSFLSTYTNKSLFQMRGTESMEALINGLISIETDLEIILDRYTRGEGLIFGTSLSSNSEAFKLMKEFVQLKSETEKLYFVDETFKGAVADDGVAFSYLRNFLKKFGTLCFNLQTKSSFANLSSSAEDKTNLLSNNYISSLVNDLNNILSSADFGSEETYLIPKINGVTSFKQKKINAETGKVEYVAVNDLSTVRYEELDATSKRYLATILTYYEDKIEQYNLNITHMTEGEGYAYRYSKGRYSLFENSELYKYFLPEYLNYFIYNTDIDDEDFAKTYIYDDYVNIIGKNVGDEFTHDEKLQYYLDYINAFTNFKFNANGNLFSSLSLLQQKVVEDCYNYFKNEKLNLTDTQQPGYKEYTDNLNCLNSVKNYINNDTIDIEQTAGYVLAYEGHSTVSINDVVTNNVNLLNLKNLLDFVGIDYDSAINSLKDVRIMALRNLRDFKEYAGESVASIRSRYLALLYLTSCDYVTNLVGDKELILYNDNKQIILDMAGLKDVAEENIVNLKYDNSDSDTDSDEKSGSIFIICTYNADTKQYEPFVFASESDRFSTPVSNYYYSMNGEVTYYPVIAKGIFDTNGNPTAIRRVNGFIEFYRDDVYVLNSALVNLEMYYATTEEVTVNYNPISMLINGVAKLITGKNVSQLISDAFPLIKSTSGLKVAYGAEENTIYHLDQGYCNLNYMFFTDKGIAMANLYAPSKLNVIILLLATVTVMYALITAVYEVISNVFKLAIYIIVYPLVVGVYPFDGDRLGEWKKSFIKEFFTMYGYVISINLYFLSLDILQSIGNVLPTITDDGLKLLQNTFIFNGVDVNVFIGLISTTLCFVVAVTLLKSTSKLIAPNLYVGSPLTGDTKKSIAVLVQEAEYFNTGEQLKDAVVIAQDEMSKLPIVGDVFSKQKHFDKQYKKNEKKADKYKNQLLANGIDSTIADNASRAYQESLDAAVKQAEERYNKNVKDSRARQERVRSNIINTYAGQSAEFKCDRCGHKAPNKKYKGKTCSNCHIGKYK